MFVHWSHSSQLGCDVSWPLVGGAPNLHRCQDVPAATYHANAAEFRVEHESYWNSYIDAVREYLGDPSFVVTDDTPVVLERFRIVERLDGRLPAPR